MADPRGWERWLWGVKGALRGPGQEHLYLFEVKGKSVRISEVALLVVWNVFLWDLGVTWGQERGGGGGKG